MNKELKVNFDSETWEEFIELLFKKAEPYLAVRGDIWHARVSHSYALNLIKVEEGDRRIVEPAIILHDVGWSALSPQDIKRAYGVDAGGSDEAKRLNRIHEEKGEEIARSILMDLGYDLKLIQRIGAIIRSHDSGQNANSMEEAIVKDSDKLWRFSKKGFKTEFERQGISPSKLYNHLLKHLKTWFFTPSAILIAQEELQNREKEFL